jgi:redox-sensitive bicupin YhaK (pirin superfamily)
MDERGGTIQVFSGTLSGTVSPANHYSDLLGADVQVHPGSSLELDLNPAWEHAVPVLSGDCRLGDQEILERQLHYLGIRRSSLALSSRNGGRILLIGGPPFPETILMWWNFVARRPEEIAQARSDWVGHHRVGDVKAYRGPRLSAPDLVRFAQPNPIS